jgi:CheY-like chemotaxis protein
VIFASAARTPPAVWDHQAMGVSDLGGVSIVLVEDDESFRVALRMWLEAAGATVREAGNGLEALALVQQAPPDVILCDLHMPEMDGGAFLERLRELAGFGHIPVIALTAQSSEGSVLQAMEAGFHGHLVKPISAEAVRAQIHRVLGR